MQQYPPSQTIRQLTQQRHSGDVAEQVASDDRGSELEVIDRDTDTADDVDQHADNHVGVERSQQNRRCPGTDSKTACHHCYAGAVIVTGALMFDSTTVTIALPWPFGTSNFACFR